MKKMIALGGAALCLAFAPYVFAQDSSMSSTDSTNQQGQQQAGSTDQGSQGSMDSSKSESSTRTETSKSQAMREDHWKNAKSCTDDMGKTYKRGSKGFSKCVDQMRQKEQMGGTMPESRTEEKTEKKSTTESAPSDSSMSSSHSDSSDSQNR